jgi:NAD-dependent deacetylase
MKKKILIFTGAGVSAESGIQTFRDTNGLWNGHNIVEVAHPDGWKNNPQKVLDFYNQRRQDLKTVKPNIAHELIASLESDYDVTVVTQNVDDLHERAGSKDIIHLHGELLKSRSTEKSSLIYDCDGDINIGDKCELGSQLRPHIVWFEEMLNMKDLNKAFDVAGDADICIVVGTSMQVMPAAAIPFQTKHDCIIYYIDPSDVNFEIPKHRKIYFYHIKKNATSGVQEVIEDINKWSKVKS